MEKTIRPEFLNMNFMRAFIAEYLEQNGYSCCEVNFVQAVFKQQPANFVNNIGYNLIYETIGYKLKNGITWKKLLEEKHLMPNKSTPGYVLIIPTYSSLCK